MSVPCTCPHCAESFKVKDKYVGREGACPKCRGRIHIHTDGHVTAVARQDTASASTERRRPTQAQKIVDAAVTRESASDEPQRVRCKTCGSEQRVRPEWAGKKVKCSVCGAALALPESKRPQGATTVTASAPDEDDYLINLLDEEALAGPAMPAVAPSATVAPTLLTLKNKTKLGATKGGLSGEMLQFLIPMGILVVAAIVGAAMGTTYKMVTLAAIYTSLVCGIVTIVRLWKNGDKGIVYGSLALAPCCGIGGIMLFAFGWINAREFGNRGFMLSWTLCSLITIPANFTGGLLDSAHRFPWANRDFTGIDDDSNSSSTESNVDESDAAGFLVRIDVRPSRGDDAFYLSRKFFALTNGPGRVKIQINKDRTFTYYVSPISAFNRFADELKEFGSVRSDRRSRTISLSGVELRRLRSGKESDATLRLMDKEVGPTVIVAFPTSHVSDRVQLADEFLDAVGGQGHCMWFGNLDVMFVSPVSDIHAYARRLKMGEVKGIDISKRTIAIQLYPQSRRPRTSAQANTQTKPRVEHVVPNTKTTASNRESSEADANPFGDNAESSKVAGGDSPGKGRAGQSSGGRTPLEIALEGLASNDVFRVRDAAEQLANMPIQRDRQMAVGDSLIDALRSGQIHNREEILRALEVWATPEHVDELSGLIRELEVFIRDDCMDFVAKKGGQRAAEALAELLVHPQLDPKEALKKMGPVAEDAVLPYVTHPKDAVRRDACEILEVIGTAKSLREINKLARDRSIFSRKAAEQAYYAIEWREKHKQQSQQDGSDETEHTQTPRSEVLRPAE